MNSNVPVERVLLDSFLGFVELGELVAPNPDDTCSTPDSLSTAFVEQRKAPWTERSQMFLDQSKLCQLHP